jgi:HSP20 family protein
MRAVSVAPGPGVESPIETMSYTLSECPWVPDLEVFEQDNLLFIQVDLQAMKLEEVSVSVTDRHVKIAGERRRRAAPTRRDLHAPERVYGRFSRTVRLPKGIEGRLVAWGFENGVLQIRFPLAATRAEGLVA